MVAAMDEHTFLDRCRDLAPIFAEAAPDGERRRQVPEEVMAEVEAAGILGAIVPASLGGHGLPIGAALEGTRVLATGCPATAWTTSFLMIHAWMLSRLPAQQVQQVLAQSRLEPMTHFTQINPEKLMERIRVAARRGYAAVENETVLGDISIAAPITDHNGLAVAAINISVPTTRWTMERVEAELAKHVQVVATSISKSRFSSLRY